MNRNPSPVWLFVLAILLLAVLVVLINFHQLSNDLGFCVVLITVGLAIALAILLTYCLCRWHGRRRMFLIFGGFALIMMLFYAEEDLRGWYAWHKFKRQSESAGEKLDFASVVPPAVAADQNFALTPIVASSYAADIDTNGHRLSPPLTNVVNRLNLNIYRSNGWAQPPTNGDWRRGTFTDLKAWQFYFSTPPTNSPTNEFPVPQEPQSAAADVLFGLGKFDSAIEELRKAAELPQSRFPIGYDAAIPSDINLPHLASLKRCSQVLQLRALAERGTGQTDKALGDVILGLRLIDATRSEPFLISHLVRMAELTITLQPIYEGLARHEWSANQLVDLQAALGKLDFLEDCQRGLRGQRNEGLATVDYMRQNRNRGSLLMLFSLDMLIGKDNGKEGEIKWGLILATTFWRIAPAGWFWMNEALIGKMYQQWNLRICDPEKHLASHSMAKQADEAFGSEYNSWRPWNTFAVILLQGITASEFKFAFAQNSTDLAMIACALERYRLANGTYPDSLDQLCPQFLEAIPHDIITGQPLKYLRRDDGRFVLYSVGWNEMDDGGKVGLRPSGYFDIRSGDWLWQYPGN